MIDPFKKASRGYDHILVAVDKFTSWMEVKPIKDLIAAKAVEFIAETVHRFGVPKRIITKLGTNFTRREFQNYYDDSLIEVAHTSTETYMWDLVTVRNLHELITTNDWCSGKRHNLVPSGPWFEPMP
jgi:hypothetical protein